MRMEFQIQLEPTETILSSGNIAFFLAFRSIIFNSPYIRSCDNIYNCQNLPSEKLEFHPSLALPCSTADILSTKCTNTPEPGWMLNPCFTNEALIEVSNDGTMYSGGNDMKGVSILSTWRYMDPPGETIDNFKNFTVRATFAVYTYVYKEYFYTNPQIMEMERSFCRQPRYSEEGTRDREQGYFQLELMEAARVTIDLSFLPNYYVYGEHYRFAIFIIPSRCTLELCDSNRVRLSPTEFVPCKLPRDFSYWFSDTSVPKNVMNNFTIYALDDMVFKIEVHILYGLFTPLEGLFVNSSTVTISGPDRALSIFGQADPSKRRLSPYVSYEQRFVPKKYFFGALFYQSITDSVVQPLNMPPTYKAYERGRALIMYNTTASGTLVLDDFPTINIGTQFWNMPVPTVAETKEYLDAYFETFHEMVNGGVGQYSFGFTKLILPYFPYFSNCFGYDSYIPIWMFLEDPVECKLSKQMPKKYWRRKDKPLPDQDHQNFVGPFEVLGKPVADYCKVRINMLNIRYRNQNSINFYCFFFILSEPFSVTTRSSWILQCQFLVSLRRLLAQHFIILFDHL